MQISFACPHCDQRVAASLEEATRELNCPACTASVAVPQGAMNAGSLARCVVCPSSELYVRKDFPQRLGVAIVVAGVILSTVTWYYHLIYLTYGIFFVTALIDFVLWLVMGNLLQCYRCQAQYRGVAELEQFGSFDLETHEKYRQQLARLAAAGNLEPRP